MQLTKIENLSAAELKSRREELADAVVAAAEIDREELAARYVQARLDAKLRDEKLAEQGQTIGSLNGSIDLLQREVNRLESDLNAARNHHVALAQRAEENQKIAADSISALTTEVHSLTERLDAETARADRLKSEAERHATAFTAAQKALADAAALNQIDAADKG